jgi:hypothetical protein
MSQATPLWLSCRLRFHDAEEPDTGTVRQREAAELSLTEATELLDWLEGNGIHALDVELTASGRMTVRWVE